MEKKSFDTLYRDILNQKIHLGEPLPKKYNPKHLDCLLHPEKYGAVFQAEECLECANAYERACQNSCIFDAIQEDGDGRLYICPDKCVGCGACIDACKTEKLAASKDVLPAMKAVREKKGKAYVLIAPAFLGQFQKKVTPGKLRTAFRALGFDGMIEVALFADILTMKESLEFDRKVQTEKDFQLTSCCCPIWIAMIRNIYHRLLLHVPGAVSPMIAAGRVVKRLSPDALTVFVGPCIAKKSEAREPDVADAIDYVLTFQEVQDIFEAAEIDLENLQEESKEHSSGAGRMYARTGGVSEAVQKTVRQLRPESNIQVESEQAEGVRECRALLKRLEKGETTANFFEGMGCVGGCVGGPKAILPMEIGRKRVEEYVEHAYYQTTVENPYVMKLMAQLGFEDVEALLEEETIFVRKF